ncbi:MAG: preprotein translocase subunit YajC [Leucobacter sp.]
MDPISLVMIALIGVLIIFMFRNGKKRQQAMQQLQSGLRPGADIMLQSGIYGTVESVDEEENRVTILSGTSSLVVHRSAVSQIINPVEATEEESTALAPDDDPAFGESIAERNPEVTEDRDASAAVEDADAQTIGDDSDDPEDPKKA